MKKFLSILLSVIMLATIFPVGMAVASDEEIAEMFESSSGAALSALVYIVDGEIVNMPGFSADKYEYTVKLPEDVYSVAVAAAKADSASTLIVTQPENDNGSGVATVEVIADDGTNKVYTITFLFENMSDATLSSLIYIADGEILSVPGFEADKFEYTVVFNGGVGNVIIAATKADSKSKLEVTQPTIRYGKGVATAEVIAKDGTKNVYTINFICEPYAYFTVEDIRVIDETATKITGEYHPYFVRYESLYFVGKLINNSKSDMECLVTMALYNETEAIEEKVSMVIPVAAGEVCRLADYDLYIPASKITAGYTVKCFIWEEDSAVPLCDAIEITFDSSEEIQPVSTNYGVVDKFAKDSMGTVSMRLLDLEGNKLTVNVADKIKLNGVKVNLNDWANEYLIDEMGINYYDYDDFYYDKWYEFIANILTGNIIPNGEDARLNKLITYNISNKGEIDEITFAIASNDTKTFGYIDKAYDPTKWMADNNRFRGGRTLSEKTVIFNLAGIIDDWKIMTIENLVDGAEYVPYYFAMQNDGTVGAVVIFSSTSNINQNMPLAYFAGARQGVYTTGKEDEEDVYFVNYYIDGELASEALPVYCDVYEDMTRGTAFLYAKDDNGIVDWIIPVFEPATGEFANICHDYYGDILDDFMLYDDVWRCNNEVFFGVLIKAENGKITVASAPREGDRVIWFDTFENVRVPETATVLQYKDYDTNPANWARNSIYDLEISSCVRVVGTQDINLDESDLTYVFFRMKNGVVTEVLGIDYTK